MVPSPIKKIIFKHYANYKFNKQQNNREIQDFIHTKNKLLVELY